MRAVIATKDLAAHKEPLEGLGLGAGGRHREGHLPARSRVARSARGTQASRSRPRKSEGGAGSELREQVEAIERWYLNDWMALDPKLRTSIVEGISVFLSLFDQPQVASMFCPPPPDPDESTYYMYR